jgi:hypothetical protein
MELIHRDRYAREFAEVFRRKAQEYHVGNFTVEFDPVKDPYG